nr:hypothetical protein CFP56_00998 [Quercus suber]
MMLDAGAFLRATLTSCRCRGWMVSWSKSPTFRVTNLLEDDPLQLNHVEMVDHDASYRPPSGIAYNTVKGTLATSQDALAIPIVPAIPIRPEKSRAAFGGSCHWRLELPALDEE